MFGKPFKSLLQFPPMIASEWDFIPRDGRWRDKRHLETEMCRILWSAYLSRSDLGSMLKLYLRMTILLLWLMYIFQHWEPVIILTGNISLSPHLGIIKLSATIVGLATPSFKTTLFGGLQNFRSDNIAHMFPQSSALNKYIQSILPSSLGSSWKLLIFRLTIINTDCNTHENHLGWSG